MLLCTARFHRRLQTPSAATLPTERSPQYSHPPHLKRAVTIPYSRPAILPPFNGVLLEKQAIARVLWNLQFNLLAPGLFF